MCGVTTQVDWTELVCAPPQAPFRAEAPLLLELFTLIFEGIGVSDILQAAPAQSPSTAAHKPRQVHGNPARSHHFK